MPAALFGNFPDSLRAADAKRLVLPRALGERPQNPVRYFALVPSRVPVARCAAAGLPLRTRRVGIRRRGVGTGVGTRSPRLPDFGLFLEDAVLSRRPRFLSLRRFALSRQGRRVAQPVHFDAGHRREPFRRQPSLAILLDRAQANAIARAKSRFHLAEGSTDRLEEFSACP